MKKFSFSRIQSVIELPSLLEMAKASFHEFLQEDVPPEKRKVHGLQAAFMDVFPIENADQTLTLEFVRYELGQPRNTIDEALSKDLSYTAPLRAWLRLLAKQESGKVKEIAEQEVYLCELPLMTDTASFVINGAERVIVSQLHRSPGVIFEEDEEKKISSLGKKLFFARLIPYRGAWVEFEFDLNNALFVRIDKKRKIPATTFLRACGIESDEQILKLFYESETVALGAKNKNEELVGRVNATDVVDKGNGEIVLEAGKTLTKDALTSLHTKGVKEIHLCKIDATTNDVTILETLRKDTVKSRKEAINEIYRRIRAQEFITPGQAETYLDNLLFKSIRKYDLTRVGRYKINKKLGIVLDSVGHGKGFETPSERRRTLTPEDVVATIKYVIMLNNGINEFKWNGKTMKVEVDDIDHLGNRRVRPVGELLENQVRVGLSQMGRLVRERMNVQDKTSITPRSIVNTAPVVGIVRKFFGTSQLSQFMDQTNPLAELTHKRRLSALGPGGLHRKRAGFEVRDVHHTHYGRICPIETPEGPNIGLITSLACYARVNEYGLIESPYRIVNKAKVSKEIEFLTADREDDFVVAQANAPLDNNDRFASDMIYSRYRGDFPVVDPSAINYMDISPMQVVSVSTALIPFLEHDDANRALMGSNMQRQAVPLLVSERPLVGTGIEDRVAKDSGAVICAKRAGKVVSVQGDRIAIYSEDDGKPDVDLYTLKKFLRSNQDTTVNQVPIVHMGDHVKKGQAIADGPCTEGGELALGKNLLVAFMPWEGYNFEDAILLNERLVRDDVFTSIHVSEFQAEARDTKMGAEEITRDIPNVGAEALINLDDSGVIRVGAEVVPGDILVGKVAPKGEQQVTPEERLLKVIFGKKAEDVQDASLRVPPGVTGKVLDIRVFTRHEKLGRKEENKKLKDLETKAQERLEELRKTRKELAERLEERLDSKKISKSEAERERDEIKVYYNTLEQKVKQESAREKESMRSGDELPVTVNKVVKVYIASKRKVQVGDKLAGRHGNKGVVARIIPPEDMPYLPDGTPVDIVLSPLSVPSRMNVGQLLEAILGWAGKQLDVQMITPVFDGAKEEQIREKVLEARKALKARGVPEKCLPDDYCRIQLYDGRTGEAFKEKVSIGQMYIIKLAHLVEDKIHARSTGPYSLITRQPLGGKAQFGGQRFGEMEVWSIEGYGAAYALQEFLTVKSDDVVGRTKMYEAIIKGEPLAEPGTPESFRVLIRELQALGLNVELQKTGLFDGSKKNGKPEKEKEAVTAEKE